jgi:hypothetical protein
MATHITIPIARLIELETAEHERDILLETDEHERDILRADMRRLQEKLEAQTLEDAVQRQALAREAHTWSKAAETYALSEARLVEAMRAVLMSNVGRQTLAQLADGQGTATGDGQAWLAAADLVLGPNARLSG